MVADYFQLSRCHTLMLTLLSPDYFFDAADADSLSLRRFSLCVA